jgi:hypothetical protein
MASKSSATTLLSSLRKAEVFYEVNPGNQGSSWNNASIDNLVRALDRFYLKKERTSFSPAQTLEIVRKSRTFFAESDEKFPANNRSDIAAQFGMLVTLAFIFLFRLEAEGFNLSLGSTQDNEDSPLGDRTHVICFPATGPSRAVVKLRSRKSKRSVTRNGFTVVRFCSCNEKKIRQESQFHAGIHFCPVHVTRKFLFEQNIMGAGSPLFPDLSEKKLRGWLRGVVALNTPVLGEPARAGLHSFRRGAAACAFFAGMTEDQIKALGDWISDAYGLYLPDGHAPARKVREAINSWEASDDESEDIDLRVDIFGDIDLEC